MDEPKKLENKVILYFNRLAVILGSILKLIDTHNEKQENKFAELLNYIHSFDKITIENFKAFGRRTQIVPTEKDFNLFIESTAKIKKLQDEYKTKEKFYNSESKMISKEIMDIQRDITDFIKKIEIKKEDQ